MTVLRPTLTARAFLSLCALGLIGCDAPLEAAAQSASTGSLRLELYLEKDTFFEDEPIFYGLKLSNVSELTTWVSPVSPWSAQVLIRFYREPTGEPILREGLELYDIVSDAYRGDSLAPDESFYHVWDLSHHGSGETYRPWTATRTLLAGEYRLEVTYLSSYRGAVFGEGDPAAIKLTTRVSVIPRDAVREGQFQTVMGLFRRLGTFEEGSRSRMTASSVRATLRNAEAFVRAHPESPFTPLVFKSLLSQLEVRASRAQPAMSAAEILGAIEEVRRVAAEQAPARLSRLFVVLCQPEERRMALLSRVRESAESAGEREARIARLILEFSQSFSPTDIRSSVHRWWRVGC